MFYKFDWNLYILSIEFHPNADFCVFFLLIYFCRVPQIESVFLNMPNLHFLPCAPVTSSFDNDVYVATSEPHGNIEATVTRSQATAPHSKM